MNAVDVIRLEARHSYAWLESIVADVTAEQAAWEPPGTANSIAATYAHAMISADIDLTRHFHGREPLITTEGWAKRIGVNEMFPDEWPKDVAIDWQLLRGYGRAATQHVLQLVAAISQADLDRKFQMMPESLGIWSGMDVYSLHGGRHIWMHGGEIACLKGLQGRKGYMGFLPEHLRQNG